MDTSLQVVEVVAYFDREGHPRPQRFRLTNAEGVFQVIRVDEVLTVDLDRAAGNEMIAYGCRSVIGNQERTYTLKYEKDTCLWLLRI